jgi:putative nucleotidyltransferase with HDIG domain
MNPAKDTASISPIALSFVAGATTPSPVVIRLAQNRVDDASVDDLETIIGTDPEFSLRVMALANSAFYSQMYDISTLRGALVLLGVETVCKLAASVLSRSLITTPRRHDNSVWRHSQAVGIGAELIAELHRRTEPRRAFVAGLLHDIGVPAILNYSGEASPDIARHAEVGAEVADCLGLSPQLITAIRYHDNPPETERSNVLVATVCIANQLAIRNDYSHEAEAPLEHELFHDVLARLGLGEPDLDTLAIGLAGRIEAFEASIASAAGV